MNELEKAVLILAAVLLGLILLGIIVCLCVFPYARTLRIMAGIIDNPQPFSLGSLLGLTGHPSEAHGNSAFSVIPNVLNATAQSGMLPSLNSVCMMFLSFFLFCPV